MDAVICLGNDLVADDGAGCAVHAELERRGLRRGAALHMVGVGGIALLDLLEGQDQLIVVDAVHFGAAPGTVHVMMDPAPVLRPGTPVSAHGVGLAEVMALAGLLYPERLPRRTTLVGVEGRVFDELGTGLSPAVAAAVPVAADAVQHLLGVPRQGDGVHHE